MDVHSLVTNLMENCVCVQYQLGIMIIQKKYYAISVVLLYNIGVNKLNIVNFYSFAEERRNIMDFNKLTTDVLSQITKTCDNIMQTAKTIDFNSIMQEAEKRFNEIKETCEKELEQLKEHVKSSEDFFIVDANYDRETEKLTYSIDGNNFSVTINSLDGTAGSNFVTTIPDGYDATEFANSYDWDNKKMIFKFKKN